MIQLTFVATVFLVATGGLIALRRMTRRQAVAGLVEPVPTVGTWGCGYSRPTPRMQYTASSFAAFLTSTFRSLLWPERVIDAPSGVFPKTSRVETHVPDIAEHDVFDPLFRGVVRMFSMVRTVSWGGETEPPEASPAAALPRRGPVKSLISATVSALRRGNIQMRVLLIVFTLMFLFLWEAFSSGGRAGGSSGGRQPQRPAGVEAER